MRIELKKSLIYALIGFCLIFVGAIESVADECHVDKSKDNMVKFISDAPIEKFEGVTDNIDGYVYWEGDGLSTDTNLEGSEFYFEVDLNTIDTGIGLRNRHMRENYLETDKKPEYRFTHYTGKLTKIAPRPEPGPEEKLVEGGFVIETEGTFYIHGVEQPYEIPILVTDLGDGQYHAECDFTVALTDFKVEVPSLMFYKIDENMELVLDFYLQIVEPKE